MAGIKKTAKTPKKENQKKQTNAVKKGGTNQQQPAANRTYKDSLFTDLFYSDETAEENLRSLYNALHPEDMLTAEDTIEKRRLENVLFNALYNDITGIFKERVIVFGEHQSTINNNIPVRFLMYAGRIYEQLLDGHRKYETERIPLPTPEFYVFYNGRADWDVKELRLSDAFVDRKNPFQMELTVKLINIRSEKNNDILKRCDILNQYSQFVQAYEAHKDSADRMGDTIKYCVEHNILKEYIERKGKEVLSMLTMDWDYEEALKVAHEEGEKSGEKKGEKRGEKQGAQKREKELIINLYQEKDTLSKISRVTGKTVDEVRQILLDNGISI